MHHAHDASLPALIDRGTADGPVIVLLHGRGSDERDLLPIGRLLHSDATTVSVRAPFAAAPWGYGPGYAWYRFLGGTTPDPSTFVEGQHALAQCLATLPRQLGRDRFPLLLGGFSQGGTSSLAYLLTPSHPLDGVLVFSGFIPDHPAIEVTRATVGATPIFWGHGTADPLIPFELAEAGWQQLRDAGAAIEAHAYPGMSHTISDGEIADAAAWIERVLGPGH